MAPRVYRFLLRLCGDPDRASDLAQEALARGWGRRQQLSDVGALPTWLFRIAFRTWQDACRKHEHDRTTPLGTEVCGSTPAPVDISIGNELGQIMWQKLGELPERQRQVLHLRVIEQMEIQEIAEVVGTNSQNVRSNLAAARKKLRQSLSPASSKKHES
ncbi:MAG: sigma-70 family RNA polymerase sigma factor [Planctomycetota bacterium]